MGHHSKPPLIPTRPLLFQTCARPQRTRANSQIEMRTPSLASHTSLFQGFLFPSVNHVDGPLSPDVLIGDCDDGMILCAAAFALSIFFLLALIRDYPDLFEKRDVICHELLRSRVA